MSDGNGNKVTHRVWVEGRNPGVGFRRLGTVFSHGDGKGFNIVLEARVVGVLVVCKDAGDETPPDPKVYGQDVWKPDPNKVSHNVFAVIDKGQDKDDFWLQLGRAYKGHENDLVILMDDAWPEDRKPVLREPKAETPKGKGRYSKR